MESQLTGFNNIAVTSTQKRNVDGYMNILAIYIRVEILFNSTVMRIFDSAVCKFNESKGPSNYELPKRIYRLLK